MKRRLFLLTLGLVTLWGKRVQARRQQGQLEQVDPGEGNALIKRQKIVATKEAIYRIGKMEPVFTGNIFRLVSAAPVGRWALFVQDLRPESTDKTVYVNNQTGWQTFGEQKLWLYDANRRSLTLIYRVHDDPDTRTYRDFIGPTWFPNSNKALFTISEYRVQTDPDKSEKAIFLPDSHGIADVERARFHPVSIPFDVCLTSRDGLGPNLLWLFGYNKDNKNTLLTCFLRADGTFSPVATLYPDKPVDNGFGINDNCGLSKDGQSAIVSLQPDDTGDKWYSVRLRDTQVVLLAEQPKDVVYHPESLPALSLDTDLGETVSGKEGRLATTDALWLEATRPRPDKLFPRGLVTPSVDHYLSVNFNVVLLDLSAVLFSLDDTLYAVHLTTVDPLFFRDQVMSNASQIVWRLLEYAKTHDNNLPFDTHEIEEALATVDHTGPLAEFVYTYKGPTDLSKIANRKETALGYIRGPGGRAVVFADEETKWEATEED
jgi:hypothetical protein